MKYVKLFLFILLCCNLSLLFYLYGLLSQDFNNYVSIQYTKTETLKKLRIFTPSLFSGIPPYIHFSLYSDPQNTALPHSFYEDIKFARSFELINGIIAKSGFQLIDYKLRYSWLTFYNDDHSNPKVNDSISLYYQKQHTFPGREHITEKDKFWTHAQRFISKFGKSHFSFLMETYVLPDQGIQAMRAMKRSHGNKWLYKPAAGYESIGIEILNSPYELKAKMNGDKTKYQRAIVQKFLQDPYLLFGRKIEVRIYTLVTSFKPLRVYIYDNGIVTLPRNPFRNTSQKFNITCEYVLRKQCIESHHKDDKYLRDIQDKGLVLDDNGTTFMWDTKSLWTHLTNIHFEFKLDKLEEEIKDIIIKSLLFGAKAISEESYGNSSKNGKLFNSYNAYQLFGIDFLFDSHLKPFLLEVNDYPTLTIGNKYQNRVRIPMMTEVLNTVGIHFPPDLSRNSIESLKGFCSESDNKDQECPLLFISNLYEICHTVLDERDMEVIIENLTIASTRALIVSEDEQSRVKQFKRIFPTKNSDIYLKWLEIGYGETKLLMDWDKLYGNGNLIGHKILKRNCEILKCFTNKL